MLHQTGDECVLESPVLGKAKSWGVARTKARAEKVLAEYFRSLNVAHFLPLVSRRRVYGARVREFKHPLFSGYVFFDLDQVSQQQVFDSRKVAQILTPSDPVQLHNELASLALALKQDESLRETIFGTPGSPVYVAAGKLKGLFGTLVRYCGQSRLIIQVTFLGKAAELAIDEAFVQPVY